MVNVTFITTFLIQADNIVFSMFKCGLDLLNLMGNAYKCIGSVESELSYIYLPKTFVCVSE